MVQPAGASWTAKNAAERVGMSYALVDSYARKDKRVVRPSIQEGSGRGSRRAYSFQDLVALRVADELRSIGIRTSVIRQVATCVQNEIASLERPCDVEKLGQVWVLVSSAKGRFRRPIVVGPSHARETSEPALPLVLSIDVTTIARQLAGLPNRTSRPRQGG